MPHKFTPELIGTLIQQIEHLRDIALDFANKHPEEVAAAATDYQGSAANFLHYLGLRPLQDKLMALGLSSLGRSEAHVMETLDSVFAALSRIARRPMSAIERPSCPVDGVTGAALLVRHTVELLGPV